MLISIPNMFIFGKINRIKRCSNNVALTKSWNDNFFFQIFWIELLFCDCTVLGKGFILSFRFETFIASIVSIIRSFRINYLGLKFDGENFAVFQWKYIKMSDLHEICYKLVARMIRATFFCHQIAPKTALHCY